MEKYEELFNPSFLKKESAAKEACEENGITFYCPPPILCTDNAAMIACAGYYDYLHGKRSGLDLNAVPNLALGDA